MGSNAPIVQRLFEYPSNVDLENLVAFPPKMEAIPVKPLFFDVAWNYIDYPGKVASVAEEAAPSAAQAAPAQKRGWFGFGR